MASRLPRVGVWLGPIARFPASEERAALQELEAAGYGAFWFGEAPGTREPLAHAALALSWTREAIVGTGIASIYARDAWAAQAGAATIGEVFPGRFVLGLGVSHLPSVTARGGRYDQPVAGMRRYLEAYADAPQNVARPVERVPVVLAALGPRMLDLARERTDGAHPYLVPVEHTRRARERLGQGLVLAPEQAVILETDPGRARELARRHTRHYLALPNYRNNLLRLGFSEADVEGPGSDRLVDELVAWGDVDAVAARVRAHLEAGADHVAVQAVADDPVAQLRTLASALLAL